MTSRRYDLPPSVVSRGLVLVAVVAILLVAALGVEYLYARFYFFVRGAWHTIGFPWNSINFAFFARTGFPSPESSIILSIVCGITGGCVWRCLSRGRFGRRVAFAFVIALGTAWVASHVMAAAVFSELLVLLTSQTLVVVACVTAMRLVRQSRAGQMTAVRISQKRQSFEDRSAVVGNLDSSDTRVRFTLQDLLLLPAVIAAAVVGSKLIDSVGVRSVLIAPGYYRINFWLPLLGSSAGAAVIVFATSYDSFGWVRRVRLALSVVAMAMLGWLLASLYPRVPIFWSTYIGSYAPGTFHYFVHAYVVWLPLSGVFTAVTLAALSAVARRLSIYASKA